MKLLRDTWLVLQRQLLLLRRDPVWLMLGVVQPALYLLLFGPLLRYALRVPSTADAYQVLVPGLLVMLAIFGTLFAGFTLVAEQRAGVIERSRVSPVSRLALLLGRCLREVISLLAQATVIIILVLPFGLTVALKHLLLVYLLLGLLALFMSTMSYGAALKLQSEAKLGSLLNGITQPMLLLSGILLPITAATAPVWLVTLVPVEPRDMDGRRGARAVHRRQCRRDRVEGTDHARRADRRRRGVDRRRVRPPCPLTRCPARSTAGTWPEQPTSPATLLERTAPLAFLDAAAAEDRSDGRVILVTGEAGIGKSALVRSFRARRDGVLVGLCDPLARSRPFGPLHDIARQLGGALTAELAAPAQHRDVFSLFLDELPRGQVRTVIVIEDAQWADDATLDLLTFLGRRLDRTPALLVLTYRDDELGAGHKLHGVLAGLPSEQVSQLPLQPLSEGTVERMARRAGHADPELYAITGGNPLLVTEALATGNEPGAPRRIRALVQAKLCTLSAGAQEVIRLLAVSPGGLEPWLIGDLGVDDPEVLDECAATGLLAPVDGRAGFRRELLRRAVHDSLPGLVRRALSRRLLRVLSAAAPNQEVDAARLAHHAAGCDDRDAVLRYAPVAARRAAAAHEHRAAAAHYEMTLGYVGRVPGIARADLLERFAGHAFLAGDVTGAIRARQAALPIREAAGQVDKAGENLRRLSQLNWWVGRRADAERAAARAAAVLTPRGPCREVALAHGNQAQLHSLAHRSAAAIESGRQALRVANRLKDPRCVAQALTDLGAARLVGGDDAGEEDLRRGLALAYEHGLTETVARALTTLAVHRVEHRDHRRAWTDVDRAVEFALDRRLLGMVRLLTAVRAALRLDRADWSGVEDDALAALGQPGPPETVRVLALSSLGRARARQGRGEAAEPLREAASRAAGIGELRPVAVAAAALAEDAWLRADPMPTSAGLARAFDLACRARHPWYAGELAWWLRRAGEDPPSHEWYAQPYRLLLGGRWHRAATAWARLGCPYQQADALSSGTDPGDHLRALALFDRIGAEAAARRLRRQLRRVGGLRVPRGPRPSTVSNSAKLTARQLEVLGLLAAGLSNADIAGRLTLSVRTVDHHVAAILAKLAVDSRRGAVVAARRLGILPAETGHRPGPM